MAITLVLLTVEKASKYFFYLALQDREFHLALQDVSEAEAKRLRAIWQYWEEDKEEIVEVAEDELHPDHVIPQ